MRSIDIMTLYKKRHQLQRYRAYASLFIAITVTIIMQHIMYLSLMNRFNQRMQATAPVTHHHIKKASVNPTLPHLYKLLTLLKSNHFKDIWLTQATLKKNLVTLTGHFRNPVTFFQIKTALQQSHYTITNFRLGPNHQFSLSLIGQAQY